MQLTAWSAAVITPQGPIRLRIRGLWCQEGEKTLSQRPKTTGQRLCRRKRRLASPPVESGSAEIHRSIGLNCFRLSFPPGTSKWNKIELDCSPSSHAIGGEEPLRDYETIVNLIVETTPARGLTVTCRLHRRNYPTGRKVRIEEMEPANISQQVPGRMELCHRASPHSIVGQKLANSICLLIYDP